MNSEKKRLKEHSNREKDWKLWGPYVSQRQWGTVREDYSPGGDAWEYTTHDRSRSFAYRWGEEGIAGICDRKQLLCFSPAFWNGNDPIIKETFFGLSGPQGNHGEDIKEYFYYLDNLPTHSYMKMLYKYPQDEYPYKKLVDENGRRNRRDREFELIDTGIFSDDRYFDIFIEYAKNGPNDILIRITPHNRGNKAALLYIIPQLWFRNTWAWGYDNYKPYLTETGRHLIEADHKSLGRYFLYTEEGDLLFCENETNTERLYGAANKGKVKDGINNFIVNGDTGGVAAEKEGTKAGIVYKCELEGR